MATQIAKAYVQIIPSAEGISDDLTSVMNSEGAASGKTFGTALSSKAKGVLAAAGIGAALTALAVSAVKKLKETISETAEYGDQIDKMSQKMGISARAYQEWDAVMRYAGTSMSSLQASMKTLSAAAQTGSAAFAQLGLSQEEVAAMSTEDLFAATISALQDMGEGTERTYLASQLLGKGATELGPLLNTSAEETEALKQRVHELGGVMSDEAIKAAAAYQDSLQDFETAIDGVKRNLATTFLPSISTLMQGFAEIISGNVDEGSEMLYDGIENMVEGLVEKIPQFLVAVGKIAWAIIKGLVKGIVNAIVKHKEDIKNVGHNIIEGIKEGVIAMAHKLIDAVVGVAKKALDGIKSFFGIKSPSRVFRDEVGKMLGLGFAEGIEDSAKYVTDAMDDLEAIASPSIDTDFVTQQRTSYAQTDNSAVIGAIMQACSQIVAAIGGIETPSAYIGDRDIFAAYNRGSRLAGVSLVEG